MEIYSFTFSPFRGFVGRWNKSMKYLLRRVLGDAHLTYEDLLTILTRAEACLNSRPLTPIPSDPNDLITVAQSQETLC